MNLSNNLYDKLKFLVQVLIPGFATLYVAIDQTTDLPGDSSKVVSICAAVATFLGLFLTASARQYEGAGDLLLTEDPEDGSVYAAAQFKKHPAAFKNKKNVTMNIVHVNAPQDEAA